LSQAEVAAAIGAALGRDVRAEAETVDAWEARARAAGAGEHERSTLAAMFRYYAQHGLAGNSNTLRWLLGRAPHKLSGCSGDEKRSLAQATVPSLRAVFVFRRKRSARQVICLLRASPAPGVPPGYGLPTKDSYLPRSCTASSARTPPVILIGRKDSLAATSALEIMT
jgi:hypothetical protein